MASQLSNMMAEIESWESATEFGIPEELWAGYQVRTRSDDLYIAVVPPENPVGPRIRGFSDRDWIPSLACTRPSFFSFFQHSATASVGAQPSSLNSLLFGISSPR